MSGRTSTSDTFLAADFIDQYRRAAGYVESHP
jgi:hypothetical protein